MNCSYCGAANDREAIYCTHCGNALKRTQEVPQDASRHYYERQETPYPTSAPPIPPSAHTVVDKGGCGISLLSFLVPIVGLTLWIVWSDEKPISARAARNGFLAAMIIGTIFFILYFGVILLMLGLSEQL